MQRNHRYDENGNLSSKLEPNSTTFYQWDHKNRLTKVNHPDGQETLYEYCPACPLGKLATMTRKDGSSVEWTWDGLSIIEQEDTREGDASYFAGVAVKRNGEWYYLMMDAMGTVFQVTDEAWFSDKDDPAREKRYRVSGQGRVALNFYPDECWRPCRERSVGEKNEDDKLIDWILDSVDKDQDWLYEMTEQGEKRWGTTLDAKGKYEVYHVLWRNCRNYVAEAFRVHKRR